MYSRHSIKIKFQVYSISYRMSYWIHIIINTLRFYVSVRPKRKWTWFFIKTVHTRATESCTLHEACHCGRLQQARTQDHSACWTRTRHDFSLTCHSVQTARQPPSGRAISLGSFTEAGDFVLQLIRLESLGSELQDS